MKNPLSKQRWHGLIKLVADGVTAGSTHVEQVQKQLFERPLRMAEAVLGANVTPATKLTQLVHHTLVGSTHLAIRTTARVVEAANNALLQQRA